MDVDPSTPHTSHTSALSPLESIRLGGAGASGGYMEFVFRVAAQELFGVQVPPGPLPLKVLRNSDFQVGLGEEGRGRKGRGKKGRGRMGKGLSPAPGAGWVGGNGR
jgi:hypothetical protein